MECPSVEICLVFSSQLARREVFCGGKAQRLSAILITPCQGYLLSLTVFITVDVNLVHIIGGNACQVFPLCSYFSSHLCTALEESCFLCSSYYAWGS